MVRNVELLRQGAVGILPTDTLYGLVACADNPKAVERVYLLKNRRRDKPVIVAISSHDDLKKFPVILSAREEIWLKKIWPNQISVIIPCPGDQYRHLHRGGGFISFRVPASKSFREVLQMTGPLIVPSANPEGKPPAVSISEARKYFDTRVDFYEDGGERTGAPSTLVSFENNSVKILRQGEFNIAENMRKI